MSIIYGINNRLINRAKNSKLISDSFWAVFGNGLGYALLLLAGIVIARFLGKDIYGEYGVVKTTMLYITGFATMGLGITSTKYIAEYIQKDKTIIKSLSSDAMCITFITSSIIAFLLVIFAKYLAEYLQIPSLINPLRVLGVIIIFKALTTTQNAILAGFKKFKTIAINNVICGAYMLVASIPATYFWGLNGAFSILLSTQIINFILNFICVNKSLSLLDNQIKVNKKKELLIFSFPIALQESSYAICHWAGSILLVKLSNVGELGLYSAVAQWNAIITFIPGLLSNVILSHLSSNTSDENKHDRIVKLMLCVNFCSTVVPYIIISLLSDFITSFYGESFSGMKSVLQVNMLCTIVLCCSNVLNSEFIVNNKTMLLMTIRIIKDILIVILSAYLLYRSGGLNGAMNYSLSNVVISTIYFITLLVFYKSKVKQ